MHLHFAGLARDCASTLQTNITGLMGIAEHPEVEDSSLTIAVNNSRDQTLDILRRIESICSNIRIIDLGDLDSRFPDREARLAFCRDSVLESIEGDILNSEVSSTANHLYIPVDLDSEIGSSISPSQFIRECQRVIDGEVNGIFPASVPFYYDIYALRASGWVEEDCLEKLRAPQDDNELVNYQDHIISEIVLKQKSIGELQRRELIPVESAFGGVGIYSYNAIKGLRYLRDELSDGSPACEHLVFNRQVDKLFISTNFVVKAPPEHISAKNKYEQQSLLAITAPSSRQENQLELTKISILSGAAGDLQIEHPVSHPWPVYIASIPLYDRFFPRLCANLNKGVVIDIGANIGDTVCMIRSAGSQHQIVAVEPNALFHRLMTKNISVNSLKDIKIYQYPISSRHQSIRLSQDTNLSTANAKPDQPTLEMQSNDEILETRTFSDILNDFQLPAKEIRAIKIDTDGYDWDVLDSVYNWLTQQPESCTEIPLIFYEHQTYLTSNGPLDEMREMREDDYIRALQTLRNIGYTNYFIFDNFGTLVSHVSDLSFLSGLARYPRHSERFNQRSTIYYFDVLLCTDSHLAVVERTISEYVN